MRLLLVLWPPYQYPTREPWVIALLVSICASLGTFFSVNLSRLILIKKELYELCFFLRKFLKEVLAPFFKIRLPKVAIGSLMQSPLELLCQQISTFYPNQTFNWNICVQFNMVDGFLSLKVKYPILAIFKKALSCAQSIPQIPTGALLMYVNPFFILLIQM